MFINSTARFRYGLPIFFTYLRNESRSNWGGTDGLIEAGVENISRQKNNRSPVEDGLARLSNTPGFSRFGSMDRLRPIATDLLGHVSVETDFERERFLMTSHLGIIDSAGIWVRLWV